MTFSNVNIPRLNTREDGSHSTWEGDKYYSTFMGKQSLQITGNLAKVAKLASRAAKYNLFLTLANGLGVFLVSKIKFHKMCVPYYFIDLRVTAAILLM